MDKAARAIGFLRLKQAGIRFDGPEDRAAAEWWGAMDDAVERILDGELPETILEELGFDPEGV